MPGAEDGSGGMMKIINADASDKRGNWIEISSSNHTYKCSECGRLLVNITDGKNNVAKHFSYLYLYSSQNLKKTEDIAKEKK